MSNNINYIKKSQVFIKEFDKEKDPEYLSKAYVELNKVNLKKETDLRTIIQIRVAALLQWLSLIQILDSYIDPSFDINKGGSINVLPKITDSKSVNDPNADAVRKKASDENNKKIQNYNLQVSFSRLNQQIPRLAKTFIRNNYTGLPNDQAELRASMEKTLKDQGRKDDFLKLLIPLPPLPHR